MNISKILTNEKLNSVIQIFFLTTLLSIMLFNRSFIGIYIFGFRLGELLTGLGLLIAIIFFLLPRKYLLDFFFNDLQFYTLKFIVLSFFLVGIFTDANFTQTTKTFMAPLTSSSDGKLGAKRMLRSSGSLP